MSDLLDGLIASGREQLGDGAWLLRGFAADAAADLLAAVHRVSGAAPFRHMTVRGGHRMSVAMTNCGRLGWVSDEAGYRYTLADPATGRPWPALPPAFARLANAAAAAAGFAGSDPDACLVNRYAPGTKLSLHQDRNETDLDAPIVSVSLGLPATFLWGGARRADRPARHRLVHGDVVVWGGPSRLAFHGVDTLAGGMHLATGAARINLTFRKAG